MGGLRTRLRLGIPVWDEGWRWISCLDEADRWRGEATDACWDGTWRPSRAEQSVRGESPVSRACPSSGPEIPYPLAFCPLPRGSLSISPSHPPSPTTPVLALPTREHQRPALCFLPPCPYLPLSALNQTLPSSN